MYHIIMCFSQFKDSAVTDNESVLKVRLEEAVPDAFEMVLNYIYSDRIDPTRKGTTYNFN